MTISGKRLRKASRQLKAGKAKRVRIRFKGAAPRRGNVLLNGMARAGDRKAAGKLKVRLK